jgi:hypothetical protein
MGYSGGTKDSHANNKQNTDSTKIRRREISQDAVDKIIYDILSSDQGLAALSQGENVVAGNSSSTKSLMTQDLAAKIAGEIGKYQITEIEEEDSVVRDKKREINPYFGVSGGSGNSVICTELLAQGKLDSELHEAGRAHFYSMHEYTRQGYWIWAPHAIPLMRKFPSFTNFLATVANSRYAMITNKKVFTFWGVITVHVGQPICFILGSIHALFALKGKLNVRSH